MIGLSNGSNSKSTHWNVTPCAGATREERGGGGTKFIILPNQMGQSGGCSLMQGSIPLVIRQVKVRTEITQHLSAKYTESESPEQHCRGDFRVGKKSYVPGQPPRSPA